MSIRALLPIGVALLPVLALLAVLFHQDSYKLVRPRSVLAFLAAGAVAAGASYFLNGFLLGRIDIGIAAYARYVAPVLEELLKGLVVAALIRSHRIGFLVDAAIVGFAIGSGFALVENLHFLRLLPDASLSTWVVRGFGTAFMHGGATALFGVMALAVLEKSNGHPWRAFLPGLLLATLVHSAFNHLGQTPQLATLGVMLGLPVVLLAVFQRSEKATRDWLGAGFDNDVQMLELINAGHIADSPLGRYLDTLRQRFSGSVRADVLCYLRLYTELSLRAKGLLMLRENGFEAELDDEARASLAELRYLEGSIGKTGLLALRPLLRMSPKDLWQVVMLERA